MTVIPVGTVLLDLEPVDIHAIGLDAMKTKPWYTIHVGRQDNAVPVDGGCILQAISDSKRHRITLTPAQQRAWQPTIDGHGGFRFTGDNDWRLSDQEVKLSTGQYIRHARICDRPNWVTPQAQSTQ